MEIYKQIKDYPNYEVSNKGNIRNIKTGRILKPFLARKYLKVELNNNIYKHKKFYIHRLVLSTFKYESDLTVDHINENTLDNSLENLRWITQSENSKKAHLSKKQNMTHFKNLIKELYENNIHLTKEEFYKLIINKL